MKAEIEIGEIRIGKRYRNDFGNIDALATSISDVGLLQPVVITPEYELIAGARRLKAVKQLGWAKVPAFVVSNLDEAYARLRAERDENTCRENFRISEALALGERLEKFERVEAKKRQGTRTDLQLSGKLPESDSRDAIGAAVGMSGKTYEKAKQVQAAAKDDPERFGDLAAQMDKSGKVDKPFKELKKRKRQIELLNTPAPPSNEYRVICGDFRDVAKEIPDGSIDAVISDPPYPEEYLKLFKPFAEVSGRVLKDGGSLVVMCGQSYLPEIINVLSKHLTYQWTLAYLTLGPAVQLFQRKVNSSWKPILWFVKGTYKGPYIQDVVKSESSDKQFHEWGQSESGMAALINQLTKPGDVIFDPFTGGGTTGVVAAQLKRKFIGAEIDGDVAKLAQARIGEVLR